MKSDVDPAVLVATLRDRFGGDDAGASIPVASAPGRVNLVGGHTDYNEGLVLPVAVDRRVTVAVRPQSGRRVRVHSRDFEECDEFDLDRIERREGSHWSNYVRGVARELAEAVEPDRSLAGADLVVEGTVPMGAGLGSSAAFELAVGAGLAAASDLDVDRRTLARVCRAAENGFVGVDCGIMDQFAAAFGETGGALFLDCRDESFESIPIAGDVRIVVTDTNVRHDLVDSAYNERRRECERGVAAIDECLDREITALRDVSPADLELCEDAIDRTVRQRVEHVVTENERVEAAAAALERGYFRAVGERMRESHASLRDRYDVSCDELDGVVEIADGIDGVCGSRMTGAGFGGSVVSLVKPDVVDRFERVVTAEYESRFGIEADVYPCEAAEGVRIRRCCD
ncbi:MAG: galactokinase [Halanaeroarchaeum sp.]